MTEQSVIDSVPSGFGRTQTADNATETHPARPSAAERVLLVSKLNLVFKSNFGRTPSRRMTKNDLRFIVFSFRKVPGHGASDLTASGR